MSLKLHNLEKWSSIVSEASLVLDDIAVIENVPYYKELVADLHKVFLEIEEQISNSEQEQEKE